MERRGVVVGVLAVVAVALAAGATSTSPGSASAGAGGTGGSGAVGFGTSGGPAGVALGGVVWFVALAALLAGGAWLAIERLRAGSGDASRFRGGFVALVVAVAVAVASALLVAIRVFEDGEGPAGRDGVGGPLVQAQPDAASGAGGPGPGVVLGVLLALVVVALAVLALGQFRRDDADADAADGSPTAETTDADSLAGTGVDECALGVAAGRAASSLDATGEPSENDVVRAWRELATVLPVARPASSTPREFAAAATAAGVNERDVAELTELFEAVRYGDRDATAERARRAVEALERIEDAHAERTRNDAPSSTRIEPGPGGSS